MLPVHQLSPFALALLPSALGGGASLVDAAVPGADEVQGRAADSELFLELLGLETEADVHDLLDEAGELMSRAPADGQDATFRLKSFHTSGPMALDCAGRVGLADELRTTLTAFTKTVEALMERTKGANVDAPVPPGARDLDTAWAPLYHRVQASLRHGSAAVVALGRIQRSGRETSPALVGWLVTAANEGLGKFTRCAIASMGDRQAPQNTLGRVINRENEQDDAVHAATVRARKLGLLPLATTGRLCGLAPWCGCQNRLIRSKRSVLPSSSTWGTTSSVWPLSRSGGTPHVVSGDFGLEGLASPLNLEAYTQEATATDAEIATILDHGADHFSQTEDEHHPRANGGDRVSAARARWLSSSVRHAFNLSPHRSSDEAMKVISHGGIELLRQRAARPPPRSDLTQAEARAADLAPVLMRHGISPRVHGLKLTLASRVTGSQLVDCWPKAHAELAEIRAQVAGVRIALVKLSTLHEDGPDDRAKHGGRHGSDDDVHGLGVQVAAESLKLRRQQRHVGVVQLERRESATPPSAANGAVSVLDLVEGVFGVLLPAVERA